MRCKVSAWSIEYLPTRDAGTGTSTGTPSRDLYTTRARGEPYPCYSLMLCSDVLAESIRVRLHCK